MTLENFGKVWHIDHFFPVCSFNLFNENQMRKCLNWKNLRRMLSKDNLEKDNKINMRFYFLQKIKANFFKDVIYILISIIISTFSNFCFFLLSGI